MRRPPASAVFLGMPASLRSPILMEASIERVTDANTLCEGERWVLAMYASGLAVEAMLQAFALRAGAPFDAKHDLRKWLSAAPRAVQAAIRDKTPDDWHFVTVVWTNRLRYLSSRGLLSHLKSLDLHRVKPGRADPLKANCIRLLAAAGKVHEKGLVLWRPSDS